MNAFYLSLGGNLSPETHLPAAVALLKRYGSILATSSVYETAPLGTSEPQPNYLNAAVLIESTLAPAEFQHQAISAIERELGRERTEDRYAARPIDIDIMLVNREVLKIDHRSIPSPEILERNFVAVPLAEIAPTYIHPITGETLRSIAARVKDISGPLSVRTDVRLLPG